MLTLSEQAHEVIRKIPTRPALTASAGLRIAVDGAGMLRVRTATKPRDGDVVAEYDEARVFLDRAAVTTLTDRELDVVLGEDNRWHFQCATRS